MERPTCEIFPTLTAHFSAHHNLQNLRRHHNPKGFSSRRSMAAQDFFIVNSCDGQRSATVVEVGPSIRVYEVLCSMAAVVRSLPYFLEVDRLCGCKWCLTTPLPNLWAGYGVNTLRSVSS